MEGLRFSTMKQRDFLLLFARENFDLKIYKHFIKKFKNMSW